MQGSPQAAEGSLPSESSEPGSGGHLGRDDLLRQELKRARGTDTKGQVAGEHVASMGATLEGSLEEGASESADFPARPDLGMHLSSYRVGPGRWGESWGGGEGHGAEEVLPG